MPDEPVRSSLEIEEEELVYRETGGAEIWRLPVAAIILIAERTTADGPADDYFLEFGTICDGEPCFTSCAVPGDVEGCLQALGVKVGGKFSLRLASSALFASRVMWPPPLAGKPLFVMRETAQHVGLARLKRKLLGGKTEWIVSAEVFEAMRHSVPGSAKHSAKSTE